MKRTTSLITTGALGLGTFAALGAMAPSIASASGCGVTTLDQAGLAAAFNSFYSGQDGGATAVMEPGGLRLKTTDDPNGYAAFFVDVEIPLASATSQANFALDATVTGDDITHHPTYEMVVDLDGPDAETLAPTWLVYEPQFQTETRTDLWWSTEWLVLDPNDSEGTDEGSLVEISAAYPYAVVQTLGFQSGLGQLNVDVLVRGMTFGCNEFVFSSGPAPDPDPENQAPTAAFTSTTDGLTVAVSGAGSADADGTIAGHSWNFGDGSAAAQGVDAEHTYAAAGTYTVTLTVTDDDGATATTTRQVTVTAAPAPEPTQYGDPLPNTGADVLGLAAIGGLALAGGGAGLVVTRRRRAGSAS
jgi:LPXTG-motif cell wall-anchored protein